MKSNVLYNRSYQEAKKMNVQRNYNPRLFEILGIPQTTLSKAQLSQVLTTYFLHQGLHITDIEENTSYINNEEGHIDELTGIYEPRIYTWRDGISSWWPFITKIYKKWKV